MLYHDSGILYQDILFHTIISYTMSLYAYAIGVIHHIFHISWYSLLACIPVSCKKKRCPIRHSTVYYKKECYDRCFKSYGVICLPQKPPGLLEQSAATPPSGGLSSCRDHTPPPSVGCSREMSVDGWEIP